MNRSCLCCSLLSLASNNITAGDWTTLSSLATLTYLDLHSNRLWGTIPSTVSQLAALTFLDLSSNLLSGSVPSTLAVFTKLRSASLQSGQPSGEPVRPLSMLRARCANAAPQQHGSPVTSSLAACLPS